MTDNWANLSIQTTPSFILEMNKLISFILLGLIILPGHLITQDEEKGVKIKKFKLPV